MKVLYEPEAEQELMSAAEYVAVSSSSITIGDDFLAEAAAAEDRIDAFPKAWPPVGPKGKGFRRCLLTKFPYQIVYRVEGELIRIYAVAHLKRRPGYWTKRAKR